MAFDKRWKQKFTRRQSGFRVKASRVDGKVRVTFVKKEAAMRSG